MSCNKCSMTNTKSQALFPVKSAIFFLHLSIRGIDVTHRLHFPTAPSGASRFPREAWRCLLLVGSSIDFCRGFDELTVLIIAITLSSLQAEVGAPYTTRYARRSAPNKIC